MFELLLLSGPTEPDSPSLRSFRSSTIHNIQEELRCCWEEIVIKNVEIPAVKLRLFKEGDLLRIVYGSCARPNEVGTIYYSTSSTTFTAWVLFLFFFYLFDWYLHSIQEYFIYMMAARVLVRGNWSVSGGSHVLYGMSFTL